MIGIDTRVRFKDTRATGVVILIHRPGSYKARYNVKLDTPERCGDGEVVDVIDCCLDEIEEVCP